MKATVMNDLQTALFEHPKMTPELYNEISPIIDDIIMADLENPEKVDEIDIDAIRKEFIKAFRGDTTGTLNPDISKRIKRGFAHLKSRGLLSGVARGDEDLLREAMEVMQDMVDRCRPDETGMICDSDVEAAAYNSRAMVEKLKSRLNQANRIGEE